MKLWLKALLLGAFLSLPVAILAGPTPEATVDTLNAGLLDAMKQPEGGYQARFDRLDPLMQAAFDYDHMAQVAAGKYWSGFSEAERTRYLDLFTKISVAAAANRFRETSGVTFETTGTRPGPQGTTLVDTTLKVDQGQPRQITYLMRDSGGNWRAIDVYYEGTVSELATKRSEYTSVIKMQGVEGLLVTLEKKLADYAKE
jgi:phospholipid transport system substrate-binding protein